MCRLCPATRNGIALSDREISIFNPFRGARSITPATPCFADHAKRVLPSKAGPFGINSEGSKLVDGAHPAQNGLGSE